jgi:hypothetical protein
LISIGKLVSRSLSGDENIARISDGCMGHHGNDICPNYVLLCKHDAIAAYVTTLVVQGFQWDMPEVLVAGACGFFLLGDGSIESYSCSVEKRISDVAVNKGEANEVLHYFRCVVVLCKLADR